MNIRRVIVYTMLLIVAATFVIYSYGLYSNYIAISFFVISFCLLFLSVITMSSSLQLTEESINSSEKTHTLSAYKVKSHVDSSGVIWLREPDIRELFPKKHPVEILAQKHSEYFRKINSALDIWYIHPKAIRFMAGKENTEREESILKWLENDVIGVHYGLISIGGKHGGKVKSQREKSKNWIYRLWRGEIGLFSSILLGGTVVILLRLIFDLYHPEDFLLNYKYYGINTLASIATTVIALLWWGHGVIMATQRWVILGKSAPIALLSIILGVGIVTETLSIVVKSEHQYDFVDWIAIATDSDEKALVSYNDKFQSIIINGPLGFGTTNLLREAMAQHPEIKMVGIKSYGGRSAEGLGLLTIINENNLDTYVWAECMSACVTAYIGGINRYVTNTAEFGLHRSGQHWYKKDEEANEFDEYHADLMRYANVDEEFIQRGMIPSIHDIYLPSVKEVVSANLATESPIKALWQKIPSR